MLRNILLLLSFLVLQICNGNSNLPASNSPSSSTLKSIEKNIAEGPYTPVTSNASNPFSSSQQRRIWEKSGNKSIHDCLPWQFSLLRKLVPALRKSTEPNSIASISSASKSNNNNNLIQKGINLLKGHSQNVLTKISSWIQHHKKTFHFALKGFGLFVLAYWVIRRVISWYQDIAEYEVLLDQTDFVYQSYGCNLNGIGEWLLSSMNQTAINQFGYESLLKSLENSLDIPCFPQSMSTYAVQIGKDLVPVVLEVDSRLRSQDKVVKTVVMRDTKDRISSSRSKPKTREAVTYHIVTSMDPNEQRVLDGAVKALLLIQARQTDAILRSTRFRVLSALNTCEDLLHVWKSKLVQKTQTFRFPLTRNLVRYVPGVGRRIRVGALQRLQQALNSLNIGAMSHDLNLNRILHRTRRDKSVVTGSESALSESVSGTSRGNSTIDSSNPAVKRVDLSKPPSHSSTEKVSILFPGSIAGLRSINQTTSILDELTNAEVPPSSSPNSDTESETNVDTILKGLNAREKILFLEEMQAELYETVGRVQTQLDALSDIGNRLLLICKETSIVREALTESDASPYNLPEHVWSSRNAHLQHLPLVINRHVNSTEYLSKEQHIDIMEERQLSTWDELDAWVRSSSSLCRESLSLVSFDRHYDAKMDGSLGNERSQSTDGSQSASSRRVLDSMRSSSIQSSLKDKRTTRTGPTNIFPISARKSTDSVDRRASTGEASSSDSFSVDPLNSFQHTLKGNLDTVRTQWRTSEVMLRDLSRAPTQFEAHLESSGLRPHSFFGILGWLRVRNLRRFVLWGGVCSAVIEVTKRSEDIVVWGTVFGRNIKDFLHRRVVIPSISIVNDVVFNNRVSLTDKAALTDSKRSLTTMLNDFLKEYRPKLSEADRRRIASSMDMTPISMEYESELKRPIQNLLSGRIARLVLIQLQFVKKELLVAMQAIDELFNANQVNLQLLAVTPAVLSVALLQILLRTTLTTIRSSTKGRFVESTWAVHKELRSGMRALEKLLSLSSAYNSVTGDLTSSERGHMMSVLYRLQNTLVLHSSRFDDVSLRLLQEDLREIASSQLSVAQQLALVDRILRSYPFFQPARKLWPGSL